MTIRTDSGTDITASVEGRIRAHLLRFCLGSSAVLRDNRASASGRRIRGTIMKVLRVGIAAVGTVSLVSMPLFAETLHDNGAPNGENGDRAGPRQQSMPAPVAHAGRDATMRSGSHQRIASSQWSRA